MIPRIAVTGGRDYTPTLKDEETFKKILENFEGQVSILHGACPEKGQPQTDEMAWTLRGVDAWAHFGITGYPQACKGRRPIGMGMFIKRPFIVEARQFLDDESTESLLDWINEKLRPGAARQHYKWIIVPIVEKGQLESKLVSKGDWIIRSPAGDLSVCPAGVFDAVYTSLDPAPAEDHFSDQVLTPQTPVLGQPLVSGPSITYPSSIKVGR